MLECNINVDDVDIDVGAKAALRVEIWAFGGRGCLRVVPQSSLNHNLGI